MKKALLFSLLTVAAGWGAVQGSIVFMEQFLAELSGASPFMATLSKVTVGLLALVVVGILVSLLGIFNKQSAMAMFDDDSWFGVGRYFNKVLADAKTDATKEIGKELDLVKKQFEAAKKQLTDNNLQFVEPENN